MRQAIRLQDRGVVTAAPGLYFLGLQFLYSMTSATVHGVGQGRRAHRERHRVADTTGDEESFATSTGDDCCLISRT
jgi:hypothetical protein